MKRAELKLYLLGFAEVGGRQDKYSLTKDIKIGIKRFLTKRPVESKDDLLYLAWQEYPDIYNKAIVKNIESEDYIHSRSTHEFLKKVAGNLDLSPHHLRHSGRYAIIKAFGGCASIKKYAKALYPDELKKAEDNEKENAKHRRMARRVRPDDWDYVDNNNVGGTFF